MFRILILSLCLSCFVAMESSAATLEQIKTALVVGGGTVGAAIAHFGFGTGTLATVVTAGVSGVATAGTAYLAFILALSVGFH